MAGWLDTACHNCDFGSNALAIKTDANGDTLWTKIMSGARDDNFTNVLVMNDGNYLFVGSTLSFGKQATGNVYGYYLYVVKTKPNGDTLWTKVYGTTNTDYGHNNQLIDTKLTPDGGFILGNTINMQPASGSNFNPMLIRCDANGDTLWTRTYYSAGGQGVWDFEVLPDSSIMMVGAYSTGGQADAWVAKLDKNGMPQSVKLYGGVNDDVFTAVAHFSNGDYLVSGQSVSFQPSSSCMYVCRLNSSGDTVWTKIYGPLYSAETMRLINDTTFVLFGLDAGIVVAKGDARNGNLFYAQSFYPNNVFAGASITNDGGFILSTNNFYYGNNYPEGYVIKADAYGNSGCHQQAFNLPAYPTQTQVSTGTLQTTYFPIYVNSTKTQITSGIQIGTLCTNGIEQFAGNQNQLTVWPNPVSDVLNVECNEEIKNITITDVLGKKTIEIKRKNIDVSSLENGVYFIEAGTANGRFTQKVIVQH